MGVSHFGTHPFWKLHETPYDCIAIIRMMCKGYISCVASYGHGFLCSTRQPGNLGEDVWKCHESDFFLVILGNSLQKTLASYPKTTNPLSSNVDVDGISDRPMAFFSSTSLGDFTDVSAVRI